MRTRRMGAYAALLAATTLSAVGLTAVNAQAAGVVGTGTPASCTEAALDTALAGGGTVTFNCGGAATITVTHPVTILHNTTVKGNGNITLSGGGTTRIFILAALTTLAINDVTVTGGFNPSNGGAISGSGTLKLTRTVIENSKTGSGSCGGAVAMDSTGKLVLTDSTLQVNTGSFGGAVCTSGSLTSTTSHLVFNHAAANGGAVYLFPGAVMKMNGGDLNGNSATLGGGIFLAATAKATLQSTGQSISISANQATDSGGAIYSEPANVQGSLNISRASFTGNSVPANELLFGFGGAIADQGSGMVLTDSSFRQNQGRFGGAVFVGNGQPGLTASIRRVAFDQNVASRLGGGLYVNTGTVTLRDAVFTNNQAALGGAVTRFAATLTIADSSMTDNTATDSGGAVFNFSGPQPTIGGYTEIHDSTIAANTAPLGGAMRNDAEANLSNVTVLNNSTSLYSPSAGAITRLHNTVLQNPTALNCVFTGSAPPPASAGGNFSTDFSCQLNHLSTDRQGVGLNALLAPLANDGPNTTWYAMPQPGSPLVNTAVPKCSPTDQRHAARPDACDVGAVELGGKL